MDQINTRLRTGRQPTTVRGLLDRLRAGAASVLAAFTLVLPGTTGWAQERQSPIDIAAREAVNAPLPAITADYRIADVTVVNTFNPAAVPYVDKEFATLRVDVAPGSSIRVNHVDYDLLQFHFHTPAEHSVNGRHAPMEIHFVHLRRNACAGDADALLVIGARIMPGREHAELNRIFSLALPADTAAPTIAVHGLDLAQLLPDLKNSWRYPGSLTAPSNVGCNNPAGSVARQLETDVFPENVIWVVVPDQLHMSLAQIRTFQRLFSEGNSRHTQPLHGRTVVRDQR